MPEPAPSDGPAHEGRGLRVGPRLVLAALLSILALVFVLQNTESRRVHFLAWHGSAPVWVWIVCVFVAGVVVGMAASWFRRRERAAERKNRKKR